MKLFGKEFKFNNFDVYHSSSGGSIPGGCDRIGGSYETVWKRI